MNLTPGRKLALTAVLFLVALVTVGLAAATTSYVPLFFTVIPLIGVAWVLTRDEPGEAPTTAEDGGVSSAEE